MASPNIPDYMLNPDAVMKDVNAAWRFKTPPDYSKTRAVYKDGKTMNHTAGSLEDIVENLVKNWEVEASFKTNLADWRTIDRNNYLFAVNGGPWQTGEQMLEVGTYNALLSSNPFYDPARMDFSASHKTFKRMMPTFAWEVLQVYSGPPVAAFKWRHWGQMTNDYVGTNENGEQVRVKAHNGMIDIQGVTVAKLNDQFKIQTLETWFDPMEMFRQINRENASAVATAAAASGCPFAGGVRKQHSE